jgi:hypothetical protein
MGRGFIIDHNGVITIRAEIGSLPPLPGLFGRGLEEGFPVLLSSTLGVCLFFWMLPLVIGFKRFQFRGCFREVFGKVAIFMETFALEWELFIVNLL